MATQTASTDFKQDVGVPLLVGFGDAIVISVLISIGLIQHGNQPLSNPAYTADTVIPFLVGWAIAAPIAGLYRTETLQSFRQTLWRAVLAWIPATLIAGAIRSTSLFPGSAPPMFLFVFVVFGLATVLPWRLAVVWLVRKLQ